MFLYETPTLMNKNIELEGVCLHYSDTGNSDGPAVVLMHGWGCSLETVRSIAAILEPEYRVLSLDLPGHGKSTEPDDCPDGRPWGVAEYTNLVSRFIDTLSLRSPALIGHSFGGRIAILLGSQRDDISRIVLVDAAGVKPSRSIKYYLKVYSYKALKFLAPLLLGKKRGERLLERWRRRAGSSDYRSSSPMMRRIMSRCVNEDLCSVMPLIKAPTLLVWGEDDTATPLADAKKMESLIPDAGLVSFKGCGHYSFLDNPGGFRAVMKSFFNIA